VDKNFDRLAQIMIDASLTTASLAAGDDSRIPPIPALGTHDPKRIEFGKFYASKVGLQNNRLEFQMLYGIRRDLQDACVNEGYSVRVYVPYGTHWYPYYMRRLAERPANIWFFISNYFKK
jgi:proline dehydrogenase